MSQKVGNLLFGAIVVALILAIVFVPSMTGFFVRERTAHTALETAGYSEVEVLERNWFMVAFRGGDKSDVVFFTCRAINPVGKKVTIYVYSGWPFKGATIRTP